MMKRIIGIIIPLMVCATLVAQDYVMFQTSLGSVFETDFKD